MRNIIYWIVGIAFCFVACDKKTKVNFTKITDSLICDLHENFSITGDIMSLCFIDSSKFAITSGGNTTIQIYDISGHQKTVIDRHGRSRFEYINPTIVRSYNNRIYVWCNMLLKFIVYDLNGIPIAEYKYSSALKDFIPYEDKLIIYNAGGLSEQIISIYDTNSQTIIKRLGKASNEHELLAINNSIAPFCVDMNSLFYTSLDDMTIYEVSLENYQIKNIQYIESESFQVDKLRNDDLMNTNRTNAFKYLQKNSYVEGLYKIDSLFVIKTAEGEFRVKQNKIKNIDRHNCFYIVNTQTGKNSKIDFSWDSFYKATLMAYFDKKIYYIVNSTSNNEDQYKLCELKLNEFAGE